MKYTKEQFIKECNEIIKAYQEEGRREAEREEQEYQQLKLQQAGR